MKTALLATAKLVIYTPSNEHLGIVPLEAMLSGVPVLAVNKGGPTETVVEGKTGWLRDASKVDEWTAILRNVLNGTFSQDKLQQMGKEGQHRVRGVFSKDKMASRLEEEIAGLAQMKRPDVVAPEFWLVAGMVTLGLASAILLRLSFL